MLSTFRNKPISIRYNKLRKNIDRAKTVIPILCVCGIILFLFLWEVSGRYATNYVLLIVLCAVQGITVVPPIRQI